MSWRDVLGAPELFTAPYPQNSQNAQKGGELGGFEDIEYFEDGVQEKQSSLLERLATACADTGITANDVITTIGIGELEHDDYDSDQLTALAHLAGERRLILAGKPPPGWDFSATCEQCGPVWLWFPGTVAGCPWCHNRIEQKPIPRPVTVACGDCRHFRRVSHPHLGHCEANQPENAGGLWDTDKRGCRHFLPKPP